MSWFFAAVSLVGVVANIYKKAWCFILWTVTNAFWCIWNISHQMYAQSMLYLVYFCLAIFGLVKWRREAKRNLAGSTER